jgi:hypothetical protein
MSPLGDYQEKGPVRITGPDSEKVEHSMKIRIRIEFDSTTLAALIAALAMWFKR